MTEYDPAEALAEIERTQQKAYAEQKLPLWYAPGFAGLMTFGQIGLDAESPLVNGLSALVAAAGFGALVALLTRQSRVRWTPNAWSPPAMLVFLGWALLGVAAGFGVHAMASGLDEPWRKVLAGGVAMVLLGVTTRPMERLVLHYSKGRVAK
ncbi:hypothetical protein [Actinocorallia populi]|uniref:hypothetical protein n=1 Tax=Actinocorallia populi TaxID=2079200 RepID=UPI000D096763|nr:hypothetical protein [Actinocorallia populi]